MDLREIGCEDGRWIELAQDRVQCQALALAAMEGSTFYNNEVLSLFQREF